MRNLKFKAFDKVNYGMSNSFKLGGFPTWGENKLTLPYWASECDIIQYTGLKDKNGVEIYEGYIVRPYIANGSITDGLIKFKEGCMIVEPIGGEKWYTECLGLLRPEHEVIGNIYETPELLV